MRDMLECTYFSISSQANRQIRYAVNGRQEEQERERAKRLEREKRREEEWSSNLGWVWIQLLRLRLRFFTFFFFFSCCCALNQGTTATVHMNSSRQLLTFQLFYQFCGPVNSARDPQISLLSNFFIKIGSHITIHIFKNYFVTVFSVFSFQFSVSAK